MLGLELPKQPKSQQTLENIVSTFPITEVEYQELDSEFGALCHYISWQLKKKNSKNTMINDQEDDVQQLRMALMRSGSYYKRQVYIESCLLVLNSYIKDSFLKNLLKELNKLWESRKRHGANRQRFGRFQEVILDRLVHKFVPKSVRPQKHKPLMIDPKFSTYCKQILWNEQKALGKQITKERGWRIGLVSLSEFDYLSSKEI